MYSVNALQLGPVFGVRPAIDKFYLSLTFKNKHALAVYPRNICGYITEVAPIHQLRLNVQVKVGLLMKIINIFYYN